MFYLIPCWFCYCQGYLNFQHQFVGWLFPLMFQYIKTSLFFFIGTGKILLLVFLFNMTYIMSQLLIGFLCWTFYGFHIKS